MLVQANNLSKEVTTGLLFEHISFVINAGDRLGIVGPNGCGKSTLLRIIIGQDLPDNGQVLHKPDLISGYLPQEITPAYASECLNFLKAAWQGDADIDQQNFHEVLQGLSLPEAIFSNSSTLSGGQQVKVALAKALIVNTQLLVLDEPTNFLDLKSIVWLGRYLTETKRSALIISHDRAFLDDVATGIFALSSKRIKLYPGGYSDYAKQKELEISRQWRLFETQNREKKRLEEDISRTKEHANSTERATSDDYLRQRSKKVAKKAKARESRLTRTLESADWIDKPVETPVVFLRFPTDISGQQSLIRLESVSFRYPEAETDTIINASILIKANDKIALLGANGTGKSTLLRLITGELTPTQGTVWRNEQGKIAYFAQGLTDFDLNKTVLEAVKYGLNVSDAEVRHILGGLLIRQDRALRPLSTLSLGERTKAGIARQILKKANLLVLDEFCAHLDIDSINQVQNALEQYKGAMLVVTHDRMFLNAVGFNGYYGLDNGVLSPILDSI